MPNVVLQAGNVAAHNLVLAANVETSVRFIDNIKPTQPTQPQLKPRATQQPPQPRPPTP